MLVFDIHYDDGNGNTDTIRVSGETIQEVREAAQREAALRGWPEEKCHSVKVG